jgi:hypothetical protein
MNHVIKKNKPPFEMVLIGFFSMVLCSVTSLSSVPFWLKIVIMFGATLIVNKMADEICKDLDEIQIKATKVLSNSIFIVWAIYDLLYFLK